MLMLVAVERIFSPAALYTLTKEGRMDKLKKESLESEKVIVGNKIAHLDSRIGKQKKSIEAAKKRIDAMNNLRRAREDRLIKIIDELEKT